MQLNQIFISGGRMNLKEGIRTLKAEKAAAIEMLNAYADETKELRNENYDLELKLSQQREDTIRGCVKVLLSITLAVFVFMFLIITFTDYVENWRWHLALQVILFSFMLVNLVVLIEVVKEDKLEEKEKPSS
jgi:hypothetical protein